MSEMINKTDNRTTIRWKLLTGASALALAAYASSASLARAEDAGRPAFWIELGGGLNGLNLAQEKYVPSFIAGLPYRSPLVVYPLDAQAPPALGFDEDAKITYQPADSDWVASASVRYGRAQANRQRYHETPNAVVYARYPFVNKYKTAAFYPYQHQKFTNARSRQSERHLIADFRAGKDVGLGRLGRDGSSVFSAGIRVASLTSKSATALYEIPDLQYPSGPLTLSAQVNAWKNASIDFHEYNATDETKRLFQGIGPELSWDASAGIAGNTDAGELSFDWGLNLAVLFGRQKAEDHHGTHTKTYHMSHFLSRYTTGAGPETTDPTSGKTVKHSGEQHGYFITQQPFEEPDSGVKSENQTSGGFARSRRVTVPNVGGFAGFSYRYANAKLSVGYRADFFFNAIDGGMDARKSENRAFYGPYASISIGIGN